MVGAAALPAATAAALDLGPDSPGDGLSTDLSTLNL
jgi:hypothetical protein